MRKEGGKKNKKTERGFSFFCGAKNVKCIPLGVMPRSNRDAWEEFLSQVMTAPSEAAEEYVVYPDPPVAEQPEPETTAEPNTPPMRLGEFSMLFGGVIDLPGVMNSLRSMLGDGSRRGTLRVIFREENDPNDG